MASPYNTRGDYSNTIRPALEGTQSVLEACRDFQLRKCIFTSDISTIAGPNVLKEIYNQNDRVDAESENISFYQKSKIQAEELVWKFRETLPPDSNLELVTIHPGKLFGINLHTSYIFATAKHLY